MITPVRLGNSFNEARQIGNMIRVSRENMGLTRKAYSDKLGIKESRLVSWETGSSIPNKEDIEKLILGNAIVDKNTVIRLYNSVIYKREIQRKLNTPGIKRKLLQIDVAKVWYNCDRVRDKTIYSVDLLISTLEGDAVGILSEVVSSEFISKHINIIHNYNRETNTFTGAECTNMYGGFDEDIDITDLRKLCRKLRLVTV